MPLEEVKQGNRTCWRWGKSGKVYCGKDGKRKALKQGYAISPLEFKKEVVKGGRHAQEMAAVLAEEQPASYTDGLIARLRASLPQHPDKE